MVLSLIQLTDIIFITIDFIVIIGLITVFLSVKKKEASAPLQFSYLYRVVRRVILAAISMVFAGIMVAGDTLIPEWNLLDNSFFPILVYIIIWILSIDIFVKKIFNLETINKRNYFYFRLLYLLVIVIVIINNGMRLLGMDYQFFNEIRLIIILLYLIIFHSFGRYIKKELNLISSKLVGARMTLFYYIVIAQFAYFIALIIGQISLLTYGSDYDIPISVRIIVYSPMIIQGIVVATLSFYIIDLPKFIRRRFKLTQERFGEIKPEL